VVTSAPAKKKSKTLAGVELFKAGLRKDSKGRSKIWVTEELQEMAEAYNSVAGTIHDAPIVVTHEGTISYGWLSNCRVNADTFLGDYRDVDAQFAEAANEGRYRKRSLSIYPRNHPDNPTPGKLNIRHVAYVPVPSVKGLADHNDFSESGDEFLLDEFAEFAESMQFHNPMEAIAHLIGAMRDRAIDASGLDAANEAFPKEAVDALKEFAGKSYVTSDDFYSFTDRIMTQIAEMNQRCAEMNQRFEQKPMPLSYTEEIPEEAPTMTTQEITQEAVAADENQDYSELLQRVEALETKLSNAETALTASNAKVATLEQENQNLAAERERDRVQNFCEGLVTKRKLRPSDVANKVALALAIPNEATVDFSENGQTTSVTPRQRFLDELAAGKELWSDSALPTTPDQDPTNFEETGIREEGFDRDSVKLDRQIRAKAKEMGKNPNDPSDYAEAMEALNITF
jgi:hypothetical protein